MTAATYHATPCQLLRGKLRRAEARYHAGHATLDRLGKRIEASAGDWQRQRRLCELMTRCLLALRFRSGAAHGLSVAVWALGDGGWA